MRADNICQIRKSGHMGESHRDFSCPAIAVSLHTRQPGRIACPCMYHSGDFLCHGARGRPVRVCVINVIECGGAANRRLGRSKPGFMSRVISTQKKVCFRHILEMNKAVCLGNAVLYSLFVLIDCLSINGTATGLHPGVSRGLAARLSQLFSYCAHTQPINPRGRAEHTGPGRGGQIRVPVWCFRPYR